MLRNTSYWRTGELLERAPTRDQSTQCRKRSAGISVGVGTDSIPFIPSANLPLQPPPSAVVATQPPVTSVANVATTVALSKNEPIYSSPTFPLAPPRARRTGSSFKQPLSVIPSTVNSASVSTAPSGPSASAGKENHPPFSKVEIKSEPSSVRSRLEQRKARRLGLTSSSVDSVIDLTGEDDDKKPALSSMNVSSSVSLNSSDTVSPGDAPKPIPWHLGPTPHILWSSKTLDGEVMDTYDKLKSKVLSKLQPKLPHTGAVPACPPLPMALSLPTQSLSSSLPKTSEPSLSHSPDKGSVAGPSGLNAVSKSQAPPLLLSDSEDETPLDQLLPRKTSLRRYSSAKSKESALPARSSLPTEDLTARKKSRRKRPYTSK